MSPLERQIAALLDRYATAALDKDVEAMLDLYAPDVRVFDLWACWSYDGATAWRGMIERWFGGLGDERDKVRFDDIQVTGDDAFAIAHAIVTYTAVDTNGVALRSMQNRLSWGLAQRDGRWLVVHQHTSVPVRGDGMQVLLTKDS